MSVQNYINILCYLINDSNNVVMVTVILCLNCFSTNISKVDISRFGEENYFIKRTKFLNLLLDHFEHLGVKSNLTI